MLLGDTNEAAFMLATDEVTALLVLAADDVFGAAALGARAIAASAAKSAIAFSIMQAEFRVDKKDIPKYYMQLAEAYDAKVGQLDTTDYMVDWSRLCSKVDGKDDTEYGSDDDQEYYQDYYADGNV